MVNLIIEHIDIWTAAQIQKANGGRGRGKNSNGQSPHGIRKLRELTLELAVRGKLVSQDSNDEPAVVLLEKIKAEKKRLIKEKKIRNAKLAPENEMPEVNIELPKGWALAKVADLIVNSSDDIVDGPFGSKLKASEYVETGIPIIRIQNIDRNVFKEQGIQFILSDKAEELYRHNFIAGDIVLNKLGEPTGKACIVPKILSKGIIVADIIRIRLDESLHDKQFIIHSFNAPKVAFQFAWLAKGVTRQRVNLSQVRALKIPIPPLAEQHRIVAKVDELMALCDQLEQQQTDSNYTHQILVEILLATLTNVADQKEFTKAWQRIANHFDTLFITEQSIDKLKQTILQLAVMGKLVPQEPTDLPAPACASHADRPVRASDADGPVRASHADGPVRASDADGQQSGKFFVYALECEDKSIYIGQTNDILNRWKEHATGKGADWTKKHPPLRLVHWEEYNSRKEAITREKELKTGFGRKWLKRELAAGRTRQAGEPAVVLLEKIAKEKARLIKDGKIRKQKKLPEINEAEKPFELPEGWAVVRLGNVINLISGQHLKPQEYSETMEQGMIPYLTGPAEFGEKYPAATRFTYERRALATAGDILITCKGSGVGKLNIADTEIAISRQLMSVQPIIATPNYIKLLAQSMNKSLRASIVGIAIPGISRENITEAIVMLPPLSEQHRIATKIDELMGLCDTLKARLNDAQTTQVQLADAIAEQAVA